MKRVGGAGLFAQLPDHLAEHLMVDFVHLGWQGPSLALWPPPHRNIQSSGWKPNWLKLILKLLGGGPPRGPCRYLSTWTALDKAVLLLSLWLSLPLTSPLLLSSGSSDEYRAEWAADPAQPPLPSLCAGSHLDQLETAGQEGLRPAQAATEAVRRLQAWLVQHWGPEPQTGEARVSPGSWMWSCAPREALGPGANSVLDGWGLRHRPWALCDSLGQAESWCLLFPNAWLPAPLLQVAEPCSFPLCYGLTVSPRFNCWSPSPLYLECDWIYGQSLLRGDCVNMRLIGWNPSRIQVRSP